MGRAPSPDAACGRALVGALLYGLVGFAAAFALAYWGLQFVAPGLAGVIFAIGPLLTFLFALAHGVERFRWRALAGALLGFAGIAVVFREQLALDVLPLALLAVAGTAACFAEAGVLVKRFPGAHPVVLNAIGMGLGALVLLPLSYASGESLDLPRERATWLAVLFLALVGSVVVFSLYLFLLQRWTASAVSYEFVLLPVVGIAISAWLTGERVTWAYAVGGVLVLAGVYVGALSKPER